MENADGLEHILLSGSRGLDNEVGSETQRLGLARFWGRGVAKQTSQYMCCDFLITAGQLFSLVINETSFERQ